MRKSLLTVTLLASPSRERPRARRRAMSETRSARSATRSTRSARRSKKPRSGRARTKQESPRSTRRSAPRRPVPTRRSRRPPTADGKAVAAAETARVAGDTAKMAGEKAEALDKSSKRIVYEVVLSEDSGNFKFNATTLPDEAKAKIDELVDQLKADPKGAYFEIEGHTDNVGDKMINEKIGMERAEVGEAVPLRAAPDSAAPHERDQLRRRKAGDGKQDPRRPRAEPPRRHPHPGLDRSSTVLRLAICPWPTQATRRRTHCPSPPPCPLRQETRSRHLLAPGFVVELRTSKSSKFRQSGFARITPNCKSMLVKS